MKGEARRERKSAYRELVAQRQVALPVALRDLDAVIDVFDVHAVVNDVFHHPASAATLQVAAQRRRHAGPHLDTRAVAGIEHADVLDQNVLHDVDLAYVLAQAADRDTMRAVAVQVLHQDLRRVGLEADTVVAIVDGAVLDRDLARAVHVPPVRVLRSVVAPAVARNEQIAENDVAAVGYEVVPLRRVEQVQIADKSTVQANGSEEDGAQGRDVGRIQIVPDLTVAVESAATVDVDVFPAQLEEGGGVLEDLLEGIGLPVVRIVGELHVALDVEVDMLKEREVKGGADYVARVLGEDDMAAIVARL